MKINILIIEINNPAANEWVELTGNIFATSTKNKPTIFKQSEQCLILFFINMSQLH